MFSVARWIVCESCLPLGSAGIVPLRDRMDLRSDGRPSSASALGTARSESRRLRSDTPAGIGVLGGIVWPRANRWGALASLLASLATNFALRNRPHGAGDFHAGRSNAATGQRLDHWDPNVSGPLVR
jgi:hypothetical protein